MYANNHCDAKILEVSSTVKKRNEERMQGLLSMILKAHTVSVLDAFEEYRDELSERTFRSLILLLTTELNTALWSNKVQETDRQSFSSSKHFQREPPTITQINQCSLIVLYYIVSVVNKYKISANYPIWTQILDNSLAQSITFYRFLYENKIQLPQSICTTFSKKLNSFYAFRSRKDNIKLIHLGFTLDLRSVPYARIRDYEQLFTQLKREGSWRENLIPEQFLLPKMTPEELSLVLSYFPDYDLNTIDSRVNQNILDRIMQMNPYFYIAKENSPTTGQVLHPVPRSGGIRSRATPTTRIDSHPNEITKYRAARLVNLFRSVILRGGQLSKPLFDDITYSTNGFPTTSIGMYALIGLRMDDIHPSTSSWTRDKTFVSNILRLIKKFDPTFQEFILNHLSVSYSIVHHARFIDERRRDENFELQKINDRLFHKSLQLKDWCRLTIKDHCPQKAIGQLNLSKSLTEFCSFGLLSSDYASQCISEVNTYKGNLLTRQQNINWFADEPTDN